MPELATGPIASDADRLLQAEATVRAHCGWHIAPPRTETLVLDGSASPVLTLPTLHLTDVSAVAVDGVALIAGTEFAWSSSGYLLRLAEAVWPWKPRSIVVTITHGHPTAPPEVASVVQAIAARMGSNTAGLASKTAGPFSETYATEMFGYERAALDRHRLPARP